ncbi:MAG: DUF2779 domain-containing protein [Deltaproteobacteria bacterium]|nr:DUF2779 domain-containing protein [Deltaproteobacteria bacterium]
MKTQELKPRYLTKTLFKLAHECPTKLYYHNKEEYPSTKEDDEFLEALAEGGFQVGALAKCYYPKGIEITTLDHQEAIQRTNELLERDVVTIFEAAICFEDFFIRVDILRKVHNHLDLIEVKSKSFHPEEDKFLTKSGPIDSEWDPYLHDVAFQTCILEKAFPQFQISPYLMLADKSKTTSVDGLNQKFRLEKRDGRIAVVMTGDVSPQALGTQVLTVVHVSECVNMILTGMEDDQGESSEAPATFLERIREYANYYKQDKRYPVFIAQKCKDCEFRIDPDTLEPGHKSGFRECWKTQLGWKDDDFDKPHIFDVWMLRAQQYMDRGIYLMEDIPLDEFLIKGKKDNVPAFKGSIAERQHLQIVKTCRESDGKEAVKTDLFDQMEIWTFPLHFIDFETSMVAIPFNKGQRPYELIAFQFSCHSVHEDGLIEHHEWIHKRPGTFPNFDFLVALKNCLEKDEGTIFRYAPHENTVLRNIRAQLERLIESGEKSIPSDPEDLLNWIDTITQWEDEILENDKIKKNRKSGSRNMVDMLELVRNNYYHSMMGGSNSIKSVLSAVLTSSDFLKEEYSKPYNSTNFKDMIWWRADDESGHSIVPYDLLPPLFEDVDISKSQLLFENDRISEGGAAMIAYAKMQFSEMTDEERNAIIRGLLKYCELDTLAMVMIYEHWNFLKRNF